MSVKNWLLSIGKNWLLSVGKNWLLSIGKNWLVKIGLRIGKKKNSGQKPSDAVKKGK